MSPGRTTELDRNEEAEIPKRNCARLMLNEMESALEKLKFSSSKQNPAQLSLSEMLSTYNKNIGTQSEKITSEDERKRSLFIPSHSLEEIENLEWPHLLFVNQLDVIYNTNEDCELLEGLFRRYVENFVVTETLSSHSSGKFGSLKKRIEQLK